MKFMHSNSESDIAYMFFYYFIIFITLIGFIHLSIDFIILFVSWIVCICIIMRSNQRIEKENHKRYFQNVVIAYKKAAFYGKDSTSTADTWTYTNHRWELDFKCQFFKVVGSIPFLIN